MVPEPEAEQAAAQEVPAVRLHAIPAQIDHPDPQICSLSCMFSSARSSKFLQRVQWSSRFRLHSAVLSRSGAHKQPLKHSWQACLVYVRLVKFFIVQVESVVTAHEVKGKVDYEKLVKEFGCSLIPPELIKRIEDVTKVPAHPFLKRGVFYAHRDLVAILDLYEKGKKFYLYTGAHHGSRMLSARL